MDTLEGREGLHALCRPVSYTLLFIDLDPWVKAFFRILKKREGEGPLWVHCKILYAGLHPKIPCYALTKTCGYGGLL